MAKELPYFRFTSQEWQNGNISLESYELKGLFIDICAYYWVQNCSITLAMLDKRFRNAKELLKQLIELEIIKVDKDNQNIEILFLNEQFDMLYEARKRRQEAGSKGGKQRSSNAKAKPKQSSSYKDKDKDKDNDNDNDYKTMFEGFRKLYPGTKRGLDTEYENMQKKHKDYKDIIPYLENIIINQIKFKNEQKAKGEFVPQWKNLQTWINNRSWEEVFETHHTTSSRYNPKITSNWD